MGDPYRDVEGEPAGPCPRCTDVRLYGLSQGAVRVFACKGCGGVFADRDVLARFAHGETAQLRALADQATRAPPPWPRILPENIECPRCMAPMRRVHVATARCWIDVCGAHGAWFDRWEVQIVADTLKSRQALEALQLALGS
jgi:Zn-finger nucleic acid-binding protein